MSVVNWVRHAKISSNFFFFEICYTVFYTDGDICIVSVDGMYFMTGETKLLLLYSISCSFPFPVRYCCWILVIALLMGSTVGVPLGIALILHRSMKGLLKNIVPVFL